ncbi:MAG: dTDP-glucose 4,6-dehydratase [bacterium]
MKLLVTGGAGFIGSNFIRYYLEAHPQDEIVNFDALTYAGNLENLAGVDKDKRYTFVKGDITDVEAVAAAMSGAHAVINFAAESHVDRSIEGPGVFVTTNVMGTQVLLEAAKTQGVGRYLQVSTDEVYGSLGPEGCFTEETPLAPNSPYSASKAGADLLVRAYYHTFGMDTVVTRCSNNYGPYQFPEKLIPLMIANALEDKPLPVYGDGLNIRDWIYVEDHCRGIAAALHQGRSGEVYNFGGASERSNILIVKSILSLLGKPESLISYVRDRPGHDRRYAIDFDKAVRELNWRPETELDEGLRCTVAWYLDNRDWWERVRSGAYQDYYDRMYGSR